MKFQKPRLAERYQSVHQEGRRHLRQRPYLIPLIGLVLAICTVAAIWVGHGGSKNLRPSDAHVVFLFDRGHRRVLDTRAKTVGELIAKLNLRLIPEDVVEPSRDTPIPEDNFRVNVYRARPVVVVDNNSNKIVTLTAQRSARVVAQQANLNIYPEDNVIFGQGSLKENIIGEKVIVQRSVPVSLNLYGTPLAVRTLGKTVAEFLKEKGIKLSKNDTVQPALNTPIVEGLQVSVVRNGTQVTTVQEVIPAPVQYVEDASLSFGTTVVRQPGSDGKKSVTYQTITQNGQVTSRTVIQEAIVQAAVPRIIARGKTIDIATDRTGAMAAAGISSGNYGYVNYVISRESNWRLDARSANGCLGLGQACPGSKLTAVCELRDAVCQLKFFTNYANGRYGGWAGAYNFWVGHHYW